jgi:HD-GYP domain-containing protein (c-di-GMP phosphodiesterase class II)
LLEPRVLQDRDIKSNLILLDQQFRNAASPQEANLSAKLAMLEFCGWIEEAMDDIAEKCYARCVLNNENRKLCKEIVRSTYGFEYDLHFRRMLAGIIGQTGMERLERRANAVKIDLLRSSLSTMKSIRDSYAHTYLKGVTPTLSAPSFILSQFGAIYDGLREVEARIAERTW